MKNEKKSYGNLMENFENFSEKYIIIIKILWKE